LPVIQCKSRVFSCKNDDRHRRREKDSNAHIAHFRVNINISSFVAGYPEYDNTVAVFRCEVGHELTGDQVLGCVDGVKWNGTVPECREVVSDQPDEDRRSTSAASPKRISNDSVVRTMLASLLAVMMYCQQ